MSELPTRGTFESAYAGIAPWDIAGPQSTIRSIADQVTGTILDAGCGTGENALFLAATGKSVTGIDFLDQPIARARQKAAERGLAATFLVKDALSLADWDARFDSAIDCGLFHVFGDDDRRRYVAGLRTVINGGGRLFVLCFSDAEPGTHGPRRVSAQELRDAFQHGWRVESIKPTRFETNPDFKEMTFSEDGPKAWLAAVIRE